MKLLELNEFERSQLFSTDERLVLRLADAMTSAPAVIPDALFAELRTRFSGPQIVELASAIAWENYRARFNRAFDVESEDFSAGAFCPMPLAGPTEEPARPERPEREGP